MWKLQTPKQLAWFAPSSIWIHHDKISHEDLSDNNLFDDKLSYDNL